VADPTMAEIASGRSISRADTLSLHCSFTYLQSIRVSLEAGLPRAIELRALERRDELCHVELLNIHSSEH